MCFIPNMISEILLNWNFINTLFFFGEANLNNNFNIFIIINYIIYENFTLWDVTHPIPNFFGHLF